MTEDKVAKINVRSLIDLSSVTEIIDEETTTVLIEETCR